MDTSELFKARLKACKGCPHFTGNSCGRCHCNFGAKLRSYHQVCPVGKWGRANIRETVTEYLKRLGVGSEAKKD
jgi:hypothetical protein